MTVGRWPTAFAVQVAQERVAQHAYAAIVAGAVVFWWLSKNRPALMPFWMPWDFSPTEYLTTALILFWYIRGLSLAAAAERPAIWRRVAFLLGVAAIYTVLQTRFEYFSQHMFFLNRAQHVVMHHLGPFLVALGCAGETIKRGMPPHLRRLSESPRLRALTRALQQPCWRHFYSLACSIFG